MCHMNIATNTHCMQVALKTARQTSWAVLHVAAVLHGLVGGDGITAAETSAAHAASGRAAGIAAAWLGPQCCPALGPPLLVISLLLLLLIEILLRAVLTLSSGWKQG